MLKLDVVSGIFWKFSLYKIDGSSTVLEDGQKRLQAHNQQKIPRRHKLYTVTLMTTPSKFYSFPSTTFNTSNPSSTDILNSCTYS